MTMTSREAFERGTDAFNAHGIDAFGEVIADDVAVEQGTFSGTHDGLSFDRLLMVEQLGLVPAGAAAE